MILNNKTKIGPTVTLFVPYDCNNCCPFCVNKGEYINKSNFNLEKCYKSLELMNKIFPQNDIVLTGGEPLANFDVLDEILSKISPNHNIYINTTLPINSIAEFQSLSAIIEKHKTKISCINISRHIKKYVRECDDNLISNLPIKHRINCVIFDKVSKKELEDFLNRFLNHEIQIRANYSLLTLDNVFDKENDYLYSLLSEICKHERDLDKELFRTGFEFSYKGNVVTYHKTLPYSKINGKIGDIIIRQSGLIYDDWNDYGSPLNINDLIF